MESVKKEKLNLGMRGEKSARSKTSLRCGIHTFIFLLGKTGEKKGGKTDRVRVGFTKKKSRPAQRGGATQKKPPFGEGWRGGEKVVGAKQTKPGID